MNPLACTALFSFTMNVGLMLSSTSEYHSVHSITFCLPLYPTVSVNFSGLCLSLNPSQPKNKNFTIMIETSTTWWHGKASRACTSRNLAVKARHGSLWLKKRTQNYMAIMNLWWEDIPLKRLKTSQGRNDFSYVIFRDN